ncbi:MAG: SDR family oxidoreductase [Candidatus Schekmanbacteria bacterium]|nr:MAG: SDR family oxidoreductase [Candidatus Schekmanbacteria bacterium]
MAIYLVTGGAGFIGSNICDELAKRGWKTRVFDNLSTGKSENLKHLEGKIEFIRGDLRNMEEVKSAVKNVDMIFHLAALPSVIRSVQDPITSNSANIDGTLNLLVAARDAGVRRIIFAGSSSAYGDTEEDSKYEEMKPSPLSPYAITKVTGEYYCKVFSNLYGIETVILRYFNVFGPRQDPSSPYSGVISIFVKKMKSGERPTIFGNGKQSRDFTFVKNVVNANMLASEKEGISGEIINIACGKRVTVNQLVDELNEILGTNIKPIYADPRPGDILHSLADIRKAERLLGYKPEVHFKEGLRKTVESI